MRAYFLFYFLLLGPILLAQNIKQLDSLLLLGIDARSNKNYSVSLELLTEVYTVAEENDLYKQQFLALNNIGANYYEMLDYGEALDNYLDAYTIALKHLDEKEEMTVLNNIAILYSKEDDIAKAEEYFFKAYTLAKERNENIKVGLYAINLGLVANQQNKLDLASAYLGEAEEALKDHPAISIFAEIALAENHYKRGNLNKAKKIAEILLPKLETIAQTEERISILVLLSNIAKALGSHDEAIRYGEEALTIASNPEYKISAYQQLAKVYIVNGMFDKALQAKDSLISLTETLNNLKNGRLYETNRVKFEIADYRRELKQSQTQQKQERNKLFGLLGISTLIIFLFAWALYNSYIKNKQRRVMHKQNKEFIELELQKKESDNLLLEKEIKTKQAIAMLEQERLKNEIENKNRKLATKALQISGRNELIKEVIHSLSDQAEIAKNSFIVKKIKELNKLLKNDSEWESFLTHFEEVNLGLLTKLRERHPNLTANDVRFISYLYMDLTTKEIASLLNITVEATRKRKERISNKVGIHEKESLYSYITTL